MSLCNDLVFSVLFYGVKFIACTHHEISCFSKLHDTLMKNISRQ